jgi:hypothetical protein
MFDTIQLTGIGKMVQQFSEVNHLQVIDELNKVLQEQWPHNDSAQLQKIILPPNHQIGSLSGSKRSRSLYFDSHNSSPVGSEHVRPSKLKRQKEKA